MCSFPQMFKGAVMRSTDASAKPLQGAFRQAEELRAAPRARAAPMLATPVAASASSDGAVSAKRLLGY